MRPQALMVLTETILRDPQTEPRTDTSAMQVTKAPGTLKRPQLPRNPLVQPKSQTVPTTKASGLRQEDDEPPPSRRCHVQLLCCARALLRNF